MNATTIALDLLAVTISAATVCASRYTLRRARNDGPARWLRRGTCTGGAAQRYGSVRRDEAVERDEAVRQEGVLPGERVPGGSHCPNTDFDLWEQEFERWRKRHA